MKYGRIKVVFPEFKQFTWRYTLTQNEINYGGHLGNDSVLTLAQMARIQFYNSIGCSELNLGDNIGSIMAASQVQYMSEGFLGDAIETAIAIDGIKRNAFELFYKISKPTGNIAIVRTSILAFDYSKKKIVSLPSIFIEKIGLLDKQFM